MGRSVRVANIFIRMWHSKNLPVAIEYRRLRETKPSLRDLPEMFLIRGIVFSPEAAIRTTLGAGVRHRDSQYLNIAWSKIIAVSKVAMVRCAGSNAHDRRLKLCRNPIFVPGPVPPAVLPAAYPIGFLRLPTAD